MCYPPVCRMGEACSLGRCIYIFLRFLYDLSSTDVKFFGVASYPSFVASIISHKEMMWSTYLLYGSNPLMCDSLLLRAR